jgi:hypothetical protein
MSDFYRRLKDMHMLFGIGIGVDIETDCDCDTDPDNAVRAASSGSRNQASALT